MNESESNSANPGHVSESQAGPVADGRALERELAQVVDGEVRFDVLSRALYATDGSNYRHIPLGVVIPKTEDDVVRALAVCRRHNAPVLPRGTGTGLCGQSVNVAVCIDFSKYMNRILELNAEEGWARVQPGLILDHLRQEAEKHHLTYGPDPATHSHCTLGGMIGNNSCGVHSVMAGRTADNVLELDVVTYDGVRLTLGPATEEELDEKIAAGGRVGEIYAGLRRIRDAYGQAIRQRYPDIPRRVSGYNLDDLLPEKGFHVARALVGSEGTCLTILSAKVRLVHSPPYRTLLVLGYADVYSAADHCPEILAFGPIGLEGIDETLIDHMKKKGLHPEDITLLPEGRGWLLAEFGDDSQEAAEARAKAVMALLRTRPDTPSMKLFTDKKEEKLVWEIRESGLGATANVPGEPLAWPGWEDAAVPPDRVGDYLRDFKKLMDEFGYAAALYGHFGQGCIHCRISFDLMSRQGVERYVAFINRAADLVASYHGSISGEHGDGQSKAALLGRMYGPDLLRAFGEFKALWDPDGRMNPGKVVDPRQPDQDLKLGPDYAPWDPPTRYAFPQDDGSFATASLRCVGVGKCRRTKDAFMCPSFLATRDEQHTTRGRAHMLFEMFRGDFITDGWQSEAVKDSLDLCLGCKGCKTECPINVDIDTYKSEFLSHHYQGRLRPRAHYFLGLIGYWARLAAAMPRLANLVTSLPGLRCLIKDAMGVARERPLPKFADQTFSAWFAARGSLVRGGQPVLLFPDAFNDHMDPAPLQAAVRVLEHWGFEVLAPGEKLVEVRSLLHYGMLTLGVRGLTQAVRVLAPYAEQDIPIVVLEPSVASVFREDAANLLPQDCEAQAVAKAVRLFSEFIEDRKLPLPELDGPVLLHEHCHQKSVLSAQATRNALSRMGLAIEEPQIGCCGMAGSFGFDARHYPVSLKIAEENLLPAVRRTPLFVPIVADGFSCRTQIKDGTGRQARHLSEFIWDALAGDSPGRVDNPRQERIAMTTPATPEVVVITGASAGLGRAVAQAFARRGAKIGLVARSRERLEDARAEVTHLGGEAIAIVGDVADPETCRRAAAETEQAFGPIDIWINNAMVTVVGEFADVTPEEFRRVTEVTYLGTVYGTRAALERMRPRNTGVIVQVGSALADRSIPLQSAYCGAKHGIRGFTDSIRSELIHDKSGVHVTMVQMPALNTPQFEWCRSKMSKKSQPVSPVYQPEAGAEAVYWAAHQRRREVWLGCSTVEAMVGNHVAPGLLDAYLGRSNYEAQQMDEAEDPNRPDNLFEPAPGRFGAHGRFDNRSRSGASELFVLTHRKQIGLGALALGLGLLTGLALGGGRGGKGSA